MRREENLFFFFFICNCLFFFEQRGCVGAEDVQHRINLLNLNEHPVSLPAFLQQPPPRNLILKNEHETTNVAAQRCV